MARLRRGLLAGAAALSTACASLGGSKVAPVDLAPARAAVKEAEQAGAAERAAARLNDALAHLREAEDLASRGGSGAAERARRAEWLALLAATEARCAAAIAQLPSPAEAKAEGVERSRLGALLRKARAEKQRLDDRVAVLQRDLELTETEVIRTKARLQGFETKAEASSALAEARILMKRLERTGGPALARVEELVAKAEEQLAHDNYGAAVFFARRAQDVALRAEAR